MNSQQYSYIVSAMAVNATIEGMKARNQIDMAGGGQPACTQEDFDYCATELEGLAQCLRES